MSHVSEAVEHGEQGEHDPMQVVLALGMNGGYAWLTMAQAYETGAVDIVALGSVHGNRTIQLTPSQANRLYEWLTSLRSKTTQPQQPQEP